MANRESNRGMCTHPCRWKYAVVEALRPGQYYPIAEDDRGSYIFNSKDLCMIGHIPELAESGIVSLKIEGRMKGINYLASVVKVYIVREALDTYYENPKTYYVKKAWLEELNKVSHRGYCTGFYFGHPEETTPNYANRICGSTYMFVGKALSQAGRGRAKVEVRNKIFKGDEIEILTQQGPSRIDMVHDIVDSEGVSLPFAQPGSIVTLVLSTDCFPNDLLRKNAG